jgi:hypothetical protein
VPSVYDPIETLSWMLEEARAELAQDSIVDPARPTARPKAKTKATKAAEAARVDVLVEALWNIHGRPEPLPDFAARLDQAPAPVG